MDSPQISKEDFIKVVKLFLENVDGGCPYCTEDAIECLMAVFNGDFDWKVVFEEVKKERWN